MKHPYDFPKKKPFLWTQGKQYGGRSLTWGGITLRFAPEDFHPAKKDGFGPNWPISYEELCPHYDFIENFCGIYGRKDDINEVPNGKYIGEIPLTENENVFGSKEELNCDIILLCASTISTLRILLNSEYKSNSSGFKDNSG